MEDGATLNLEGDDSAQPYQNNQSGVSIEPTAPVDGLECRISTRTRGVVTAYLTDSGGDVLERRSIATLDPGESFTFTTSLNAGETYWILCDARGRNYVRGRAAVSYPIESESLIATQGIYSGNNQSESYRYCIDRIRPAGDPDTLSLGSDEQAQSWSGLDDWSGVRIQATADITDVECRLSTETDGVTTAYLLDDAETVLDQQSISGIEGGERFSFDAELAAGEVYRIVCGADGDSYTRGRTAVDYPLESTALVATHGVYSGNSLSDGYRYCIDQIQPVEIRSPSGAALDLGSDDEAQSWSGLENRSGVRIQPTQSFRGLECRLSAETEGLITAYLTTDEGAVLERQTIATLQAGDTFGFETRLDAYQTYWIVVDARGDAYVRGRSEADFPIQNDSLAVTHGIYGGTERSNNYRYCIDRIMPGPVDPVLSTLDLESDDEAQSWGSLDDRSGVRIETDEDLSGLKCRLSSETAGVTRAYLTDDSETVLEQQSIDDLGPGGTITFTTPLEAGQAYWIVFDGGDDSYIRGRAAVDYPVGNGVVRATHGIYGGNLRSNDYRYCLDQISPQRRASVLNLEDDSQGQSWEGLNEWAGVRLQPTASVDGLACRLSGATEGVTTAYLTDDSGSVLEEQPVAGLEAGEVVIFGTELEAGTSYWVVCDADGQEYTRGRTAVDYPLEGPSLTATHGIYSGDLWSDNYRYCIDRVVEASERAVLETTAGQDETLTLENDTYSQSWNGLTERAGVRLRTRNAVNGLECRISTGTVGVTTAYLTDDSGTVLDEQSIAPLEAGETVTFETELEANSVYWVVCDADGQEYTRGRAAVNYPVASASLEATHGIYTGNLQSEDYRYCIDRIRPIDVTNGLTGALTSRPLEVTTIDVASHPAINEDGDLAAELLAFIASLDEVNHEFVLPMGEYTWNTEFQLYDPIEYLEIRGDPRATLQIRDHNVDLAFELGLWADEDPPAHVAFRNLDVDIADQPERDAGLITAHVGRCLIDNVELVGQRWRHGPAGGSRYTCLVNTRESDAFSLLRNISLPDGEIADATEPSVGHSIGFSSDPPHEGINLWQQCYVEDYVDNGVYVSNSVGNNLVVRATAVNCGNGTLRIGADDEARDCRVVLDAASDQIYPGTGLWFNGGEPVAERIEIDGSDAQNDIVRINSGADGGYITDLDVFCGPNVVAPTLRCTYTSETNPSGILIEDFVIDDVTTADDKASVRIRRPDVTLRSGEIEVANRPSLSGAYDPDLNDVDIV
ncbi:hypothetical protein GWG54_17010 [Natronococcus sp. JC468]|nr:hypothetical protein [Natronococcus sp. JC468]